MLNIGANLSVWEGMWNWDFKTTTKNLENYEKKFILMPQKFVGCNKDNRITFGMSQQMFQEESDSMKSMWST